MNRDAERHRVAFAALEARRELFAAKEHVATTTTTTFVFFVVVAVRVVLKVVDVRGHHPSIVRASFSLSLLKELTHSQTLNIEQTLNRRDTKKEGENPLDFSLYEREDETSRGFGRGGFETPKEREKERTTKRQHNKRSRTEHGQNRRVFQASRSENARQTVAISNQKGAEAIGRASPRHRTRTRENAPRN